MFLSSTDTDRPSLPAPTSAHLGEEVSPRTRELKFRVGQVWPLSLFKVPTCLNMSYQGRIEPERTCEKMPGSNTPIFEALRPSTLVHLGLSWHLLDLLCLRSHPLLLWLLSLTRAAFQKANRRMFLGLAILPVFSGCFLHPVVEAAECVALQLSEQQCECPSCCGLPWETHVSIRVLPSLHAFEMPFRIPTGRFELRQLWSQSVLCKSH